jgi:hypothetical protein
VCLLVVFFVVNFALAVLSLSVNCESRNPKLNARGFGEYIHLMSLVTYEGK